MALPITPDAKITSASTVGLPRESRISLARYHLTIFAMLMIVL